MRVAALYVQKGGVYYGLPDVDPWDEARDARKYGPWPVVAHPPCSRWCQLAFINQKRYGHKVGDDGGCFEAALGAVRRYGGVLEHPARSYAWERFGLLAPKGRGWRTGAFQTALGFNLPKWTHGRSWVCEVSQAAYGHAARKLTWLYYVGDEPPPSLNWSRPRPTAQVSFCKNHGNSPLPRLGKKAAAATPTAFRDLLLSIARGASQPRPAPSGAAR